MRLLPALIWAEPLHAHGLGEAEARHQYGRFPRGRGTRSDPRKHRSRYARRPGDGGGSRLPRAEGRQEPLFELAVADRPARSRDPEHLDAHLQLALALGHLGELNGPIQTHL